MDSHEGLVELDDPGSLKEVANLKAFLERTIKGQAKAVDSVCKIYEYDLTLRWLEERQGPLGTFMFLGPSGVGKTELSRMLSQYFMGSVDAMVKIDCSAFSQPHMIHALIGAPHGYIGYNNEPPLSMEKLMSRFKSKKSPNPSISPSAIDLIEKQKAGIIRLIQNLSLTLKRLENDFKLRRTFIKGIKGYHRVLYGSGDNRETFADLLRDEETRFPIISMLHPESVEILDGDLANPAEDVAILLGLSSELKQIYRTHKETEISIVKLREELLAISRKRITGLNTQSDPKKDQEINKEPEPRLVLLFDEIEKGNQALHNLLLQIMEDGKLTLANGNVTNLRNAFIIMTSNIGSSAISGLLKGKRIGFTGSDKRKKGFSEEDNSFEDLENRVLKVAEKEMEKTFSSAFRGRIDETIVFRPLTRQAFYDILDYHIEIFTQSLNVLGLALTVDQEVKDVIVAQSLHRPEVGARLLEHKFKSLLKIPLGHRLAVKKDVKGTIKASLAGDNKIKFYIGKLS